MIIIFLFLWKREAFSAKRYCFFVSGAGKRVPPITIDDCLKRGIDPGSSVSERSSGHFESTTDKQRRYKYGASNTSQEYEYAADIKALKKFICMQN